MRRERRNYSPVVRWIAGSAAVLALSAGAAHAQPLWSVSEAQRAFDDAAGVTLPYYRNSGNPLINDAAAFPCNP